MVRVYRTGSWEEEFSFAAGKFVLGLAVSPDSRTLAIVLDKEPVMI